jgi:hypothetical protein
MKAKRRHSLKTSELERALNGLERAGKGVRAIVGSRFEECDPVTTAD